MFNFIRNFFLKKFVSKAVFAGIAAICAVRINGHALPEFGIAIDPVTANTAVTAALTGLMAALENWFKHRKDGAAVPPTK